MKNLFNKVKNLVPKRTFEVGDTVRVLPSYNKQSWFYSPNFSPDKTEGLIVSVDTANTSVRVKFPHNVGGWSSKGNMQGTLQQVKLEHLTHTNGFLSNPVFSYLREFKDSVADFLTLMFLKLTGMLNLGNTKKSLLEDMFLNLFNCRKVYKLSTYITPKLKINHDLSEYYVDAKGNLYSLNDDTYTTKFGTRFLKCSDKSTNKVGQVINSLRDTEGRKVTIRRDVLMQMVREGKYQEVLYTNQVG